MVFQSYALYPHMTVYDNLAFGLKLRKVPKADIDKRVQEAAGILDLGKLLAAQAEGAVRRPAPARRARPGDRPRAGRVPDGRAAVEPRRQAARPDPGRDRPPPPAPQDDDGLRHPRPDRGDDDGDPDRGHERRAPPAGRHPAGALRHAGQPVRRRLHRQPGDELRRRDAERRRRRRDARGRRTSTCRSRPGCANRSARPAGASSSPGSGPSTSTSARPARARRPSRSRPTSSSTSATRSSSTSPSGPRSSSRSSAPSTGSGPATSSTSSSRWTSSTCSTPRPAPRSPASIAGRDHGRPDGGSRPTGGARGGDHRSVRRPRRGGRPPRDDGRHRGSIHRGRTLTFRVDTIERADGSRHQREIVGHPGRGRDRRARRRRPGPARPPVPDGRRPDPARDPGRDARRRRGDRGGRGPGPGRRPRARGGDRPAGRRVAQARGVLDGARLRDRADAPLPGDRAAGRPTTDGSDPDEDEALVARPGAVRRGVAAAEDGRIADAKSIVGLLRLARLRTAIGSAASQRDERSYVRPFEPERRPGRHSSSSWPASTATRCPARAGPRSPGWSIGWRSSRTTPSSRSRTAGSSASARRGSTRLTVHPGFRRRGHGRRLVEAARALVGRAGPRRAVAVGRPARPRRPAFIDALGATYRSSLWQFVLPADHAGAGAGLPARRRRPADPRRARRRPLRRRSSTGSSRTIRRRCPGPRRTSASIHARPDFDPPASSS